MGNIQILGGIFMEVKKLNLARIISAILICGIMIFCTGLNVHAEESKDGISVTVSSDKENYSSANEVNLKVTVKNTNNFEVINLKIENILPDGISLVSGDISKDNINLQANEETTMNLTVKKSDSGQANTTGAITNNASATEKNTTVSKSAILPNTGDNKSVLIALIVMLVSILVMIICFLLKDRKKYSKFLSVLICLGVINVLGITGVIHASSENINNFTYEYTYRIDNADYIHKIIVSYSLSENNNGSSNSNNNNNSNYNNEQEIKDLTKNAESTINCMINADYSKDFYYITMYGNIKEEAVGLSELSNAVMSNMKYKFNDIELNKDDKGNIFAIIKCEFENVDMIDLVYQLQEENHVEYNEENRLLMLDKVKNKDFKTKTFNIDLAMMKIDNIWYLYETPDFNDAITGGLYSQYTLRENAILKELEKGSKRGN